MLDRENQTIILSDGRTLGFAQYGSPNGRPVFYFTGGNSSRFEGRWFGQAAQKHNINLIVPDRPGFGLSDFQPNRSFLDWPQDVNELASSLELDSFAVFGLSGGSPHVLAVADQMASRVSKSAIISGVAPPEMPNRFKGMWFPVKLIFFFSRRMPFMSRVVLKQMGAFYADKEQMLTRMKQALPQPDIDLIEQRPEIIDVFSLAAMEAHKSGIEGDAHEWQLYVRPWGIDLASINSEIGLWYGNFDKNVPVGMGQYLHNQLPNSQLKIVEDGGHFSTINNYIEEIFKFLVDD